MVLTWGCGSGGQLGTGALADSLQPLVVEGALRGRQILQARTEELHEEMPRI